MNQLEKILCHSAINVPYYIDYFKKKGNKDIYTIDDFPIIEKQNLQTDEHAFIAKTYDIGKLIKFSTSGTTGVPINVYKTPNEYYLQLLNLWRIRKNNYGIGSTNKCLSLEHIMENSELYTIDRLSLSINMYMLNESNMDIVKPIIEHFRPEYMIVYPSLLNRFFVLNNYAIPNSIRYIEFIGESVTHSFFKQVQNATTANITSNYGATEMFGIAFTCENQHLHCLPNSTYVEVLTEGGAIKKYGEGHLLLTSLQSYAMPFIRYKIGDVGKVSPDERHICTISGDIIELAHCRSFDRINVLGENATTECFVIVLDSLTAKFNYIIEAYQIVRKSDTDFILRLQMKKGYEVMCNTILRHFIVALPKVFSICVWTVEIYSLFILQRGKHKFYIEEYE